MEHAPARYPAAGRAAGCSPPLTSQLVSLIKDTSLVSAIAVADLTMQAQVLIADTFLAFEIWLIVAALYLALTLCVALPARWMERRYAWR